jgi:hypothetical protein
MIADRILLLDDVQFVKREWQNRAFLRAYNNPDRLVRFTLPVHCARGQQTLISELQFVDYQLARRSINRMCMHLYGRSPFYGEIEAIIDYSFPAKTPSFVDLCIRSMIAPWKISGKVFPAMVMSSDLKISYRAQDRLMQACRILDDDQYVSGSGGRNYMMVEDWERYGILLRWQNWIPPQYPPALKNLTWRNISYIDFVARDGLASLFDYLINQANTEADESL